jgi:O-antigen/teichoic acid export membrane protein
VTDRDQSAAAEIGQVARGSVINLGAMALGAVLAFGLTVLVSRWLQPAGAGGFFELIALFTIASNMLYLGADTGLTRWISRARAIGGITSVRRIVKIALWPVLLVGTGAAAAIWVAAPELARVFLSDMNAAAATSDIRIIAPFVPLGALSAVILAGPRGFGRMWPYLAVEGLGKPAIRVGLVLVALMLGWGVPGAILGWSLPVILGLIASWLILAELVRAELAAWRQQHAAGPGVQPPGFQPAGLRSSGPHGTGHPGGPDPNGRLERGRHRATRRSQARQRRYLGREFWRFAAPRGFAGTFQVVVVWLDVLLVGAILSRYSAGIYAAVSKLALLGAYTLEATRLAIGPQLSKFLARHQAGSAAELHQSATRWLMIASFPFYVLAAIFPAVVLGIFGHRYTAGAAALTVLALAMLVNLGTGNVTVVLLMGGKSSLSAWNALAALAVNIGLNLILLPRMGIVGAAVAWAASIVVENVAAVVEVWLTLGIGAFGTGYWLVAVTSTGCFAAAGLGARMLLHQTLPALVAATAVGLVVFAAILYVARSRLQLAGLAAAMRMRAAAAAPGQQPA